MDKITYLAELAEGLARWVPERERRDILRYYAEYFEEAGPDREAEVVQELGDPWALSCRLAVEGGYVSAEQAASWTPPKKKRWPWMLIGAAAVLVFVLPAVALAASRVGRVVGQVVYSNVMAEDVASVASVEEAVPGGVTYIYGKEPAAGFWSVEDGSMDVFDAIDVEVGVGNVTVVPADDYTLFIEQSTGLGGYHLDWEVKNGTLKLKNGASGKDVTLDDLKALFSENRYVVDVTITVPEGVVLDQLSVETGMGNVLLSDVGAEKLEAKSGTGDVECYEPKQVKKLDLESGTGDLTLDLVEPCKGLEIELDSGIGNVEARLGWAARECEYELESGIGNLTVDGVSRGRKAEHKGDARYKLEVESGIGDVNVYFYGGQWE